MLKKINIIILFFGVNFSINAQKNSLGNDLLIKLTLFKESLGTGELINNQLLDDFLKVRLKIDTLKQEGFEHFDFYAINPKIDLNGQSYDKLPIVKSNCDEYILAIGRGSRNVYRLKGFFSNDFSSFLRALKILNYDGINRKNKFVYWYYVERLNLDCLFEAYDKKSFDTNKYPCLHYCSELMITHGR